MNRRKGSLLLIALLTIFSSCTSEQKSDHSDNNYYKSEMYSLHSAIEEHFHDSESGYYFVDLDPQKRETKFGHWREYSWFWALCTMFEAANELEKADENIHLVDSIYASLQPYYDPAPPVSGYNEYIMELSPGQRYYDDNQWVGITALDVYERTGDKTYLDLGKEMYDFMMNAYDTTLGGGLYWRENDFETKNTCSNGPGIIVAVKMYNATKEQGYLDTALMLYDWTNKNLKTPSGLYYDNIKTEDGSIGEAIYSYNTGTMLQSNVYLYEITGDDKYLKEAIALADSSLEYFYKDGKFKDLIWFNAVLLRGYQHLLKHNDDMKYISGFKQTLDNTLKENKTEEGLFARDGEVVNLVEHGGMLEILARFALLEDSYDL